MRLGAKGRDVAYTRDPSHWLLRYSPRQWISAALKEFEQAELAAKERNIGGAVTGCKRAAGMALNAALILEPNETWGRTYVEHVKALAKDAAVPEPVRVACRALLEAKPPAPDFVRLRTKKSEEGIFEAARDVMAHAYAIVVRHEGVRERTEDEKN